MSEEVEELFDINSMPIDIADENGFVNTIDNKLISQTPSTSKEQLKALKEAKTRIIWKSDHLKWTSKQLNFEDRTFYRKK